MGKGKLGKWLKKAAGNVLDVVTTVAPAVVGIISPAAGNLLEKILPNSTEDQRNQLTAAVSTLVAQPQGNEHAAGSAVKNMALGMGIEPNLASAVGALGFAAASLPPAEAQQALVIADNSMAMNEVQSFTKDDIKTVLNGAVQGAKDGAMGAFLDGTATGKETVKTATNAKMTDMMPKILLVVVGLFILSATGVLSKLFGRR